MNIHANAQTCPHCRALIVSRVYKTLYLSWDSAPWHRSERLIEHLGAINETAHPGSGPRIVILPLPTSAQFLNVIESVFSGMARAVLHNSDYASVEEATAAVARYFDERNREFESNPRKAGKKIWGQEPVNPSFRESNNCKDPRWMGWPAKRASGRAQISDRAPMLLPTMPPLGSQRTK